MDTIAFIFIEHNYRNIKIRLTFDLRVLSSLAFGKYAARSDNTFVYNYAHVCVSVVIHIRVLNLYI